MIPTQSVDSLPFYPISAAAIRRLWWMAGLLGALAVCVVVGWVCLVGGPTQRLLSKVEEGDLEGAVQTYDQVQLGQGYLQRELARWMNGLPEAFCAQDRSQEQIRRSLSCVKALPLPALAARTQDVWQTISVLQKSRQCYLEGLTRMKQGNHAQAILAFSQVVPEDSFYPQARKQLQQACDNLRSGSLGRAQTLAQAGQLVQAIEVLDGALTYLPGDRVLLNQRQAYQNASATPNSNSSYQIDKKWAITRANW